MKQVMPVQATKEPGLFDSACLWQMHAPVDVLINQVVGAEGGERAPEDRPVACHRADGDGWDGADEDEGGTIPPRHGDGLAVIWIDQVVGMICFKDLMMHDGMCLEGIAKLAQGAMHDKAMQGPLKERGEGCIADETDAKPKENVVHEKG